GEGRGNHSGIECNLAIVICHVEGLDHVIDIRENRHECNWFTDATERWQWLVCLSENDSCASFNIPNTKSWRTGKADQSSPPLLLLFLLLPPSLRPCRQDGRLNIMLPIVTFFLIIKNTCLTKQ